MGLSIIIPAYREADNLRTLLPELKQILSSLPANYDITVIDAQQSADGTKAICEKNGIGYSVQSGKGYGDAIRRGIGLSSREHLLVLDAGTGQNGLRQSPTG